MREPPVLSMYNKKNKIYTKQIKGAANIKI